MEFAHFRKYGSGSMSELLRCWLSVMLCGGLLAAPRWTPSLRRSTWQSSQEHALLSLSIACARSHPLVFLLRRWALDSLLFSTNVDLVQTVVLFFTFCQCRPVSNARRSGQRRVTGGAVTNATHHVLLRSCPPTRMCRSYNRSLLKAHLARDPCALAATRVRRLLFLLHNQTLAPTSPLRTRRMRWLAFKRPMGKTGSVCCKRTVVTHLMVRRIDWAPRGEASSIPCKEAEQTW